MPQHVHIIITGFGPFAHITDNPSSTVGRHVATHLREENIYADVDFIELETSIGAVMDFFGQLRQRVEATRAADAQAVFLLLHIGVHSGERGGIMRVEVKGYNELHASVPDVRGVSFNHDPIDANDGDVTASLESAFVHLNDGATLEKALTAVRARATSRSNADDDASPTSTWIISENAGRYICNATLYMSLKEQIFFGADLVRSVFVHVCSPTSLAPSTTAVEGPGTSTNTITANPSMMAQQAEVLELAHQLADSFKRD